MTGGTTIRILDAFAATLQDLGRVGHERIGVNRSGASDVFSARAGNILVGNAVDRPLLEITDSGFSFEAERPVVVAITGARVDARLDGDIRLPLWEPIRVPAGRTVCIAAPSEGYRAYIAFAGGIDAETLWGSVSPLPARDFENSVAAGDRLRVSPPRRAPLPVRFARVLEPAIGALLSEKPVAVLQTAQARLFEGMERLYAEPFTMSPRSNAVGARFSGDTPIRRDDTEIISRSVPIGAIEIPSSGELIALLRGRLITAGYPIPAVIARADIDAVAQRRPGSVVRFVRVDEQEARWLALHQESALRRLLEHQEDS